MRLARLKGELVNHKRARRRCKVSTVRGYLDDVIDELDEEIVVLELEAGIGVKKREDTMNKKQERKHCKATNWIMTAVIIALLAAAAFSGGCRTVKGAADGFMLDGQALFDYAVEHKNSSTEN